MLSGVGVGKLVDSEHSGGTAVDGRGQGGEKHAGGRP